tara:strand:- start:976 stop:1356 length:381 start_codon:yes stop_codon:yes gene_type:complete
MMVKIKNLNGFKKFLQIILIFISLVILPINTHSAELLQINDVNTILVGDQNRTLSLSLYCININENEKEKAIRILKKNFPRGTKVKIKPYRSDGNRLLAKIFRVDDETEMTQLLNSFDSSDKNCMN